MAYSIIRNNYKELIQLRTKRCTVQYHFKRYRRRFALSDNAGVEEQDSQEQQHGTGRVSLHQSSAHNQTDALLNASSGGNTYDVKRSPKFRGPISEHRLQSMKDGMKAFHELPEIDNETIPQRKTLLESDLSDSHDVSSTINSSETDYYFFELPANRPLVGDVTNSVNSKSKAISEKVSHLLKPEVKDEEVLFKATFGMIKFDPLPVGKLEVDKNAAASSMEMGADDCDNNKIPEYIDQKVKSNIFDEQYIEISERKVKLHDSKHVTPDANSSLQKESLGLSAPVLGSCEIDSSIEKVTSVDEQTNFFEEQYFPDQSLSHISRPLDMEESHSAVEPSVKIKQTSNVVDCRLEDKLGENSQLQDASREDSFSLFDEQYFQIDEKGIENSSPNMESPPNSSERKSNTSGHFKILSEEIGHKTHIAVKNDKQEKSNLLNSKRQKGFIQTESTFHKTEGGTSQKFNNVDKSFDPDDNIHIVAAKKKERKRIVPNYEEPQTAYDMAMKIRREQVAQRNEEKMAAASTPETQVPRFSKWTGEVDSKGFRILTSQVQNLEYLPRDVVVKILKDSIIYEDDDLIALDKPYGLASHGGPSVHHSVGQLLENLANRLRLEKLFMVHRLDKETTGVIILAKNQQSQYNLHHMFVKQQMIKKYWLLTKGVPSPLEGVIDIPMGIGQVGGKDRMALRPRYTEEQKELLHTKATRPGGSNEAVTHYKVLDSSSHSALVECKPETGKKHQIRCHMAFGLNTPVLGDHKYSHFSKLAPQKLHPEILQHLGIRQAKVRHLSMHLHAKQLVIPDYKDGRHLFISAELPRHFKQNMKWLKIKPPKS